MNIVDVSVTEIEPPQWLDRLERFALKVLDLLELDNWEVSVLLCNDRFIQDLNRRFRGKDEPTDVLSFEQGLVCDEWSPPDGGRGPHIAGDIVISLDTLHRHAELFEVPAEEELKRLVVHGLLHLNGMDHADNAPEQEMLKLQESILQDIAEEKLF
jgi:probable rRNA maturation factor